MIGNWTKEQWIAWAAAAVMASVGSWIYMKGFRRSSTEEGAKQRVAKALLKYAKAKKGAVINNVTVVSGAERTVIDHLLIGSFGILFVTTFNQGAIIYGEPRKELWRMKERRLDKTFPNPLLKAERDMELVRQLLSRHGVFGVPMEPLAVFAERAITPEFNLGGADQVTNMKTFDRYFKRGFFERDAKVDVKKVEGIILAAQAEGAQTA